MTTRRLTLILVAALAAPGAFAAPVEVRCAGRYFFEGKALNLKDPPSVIRLRFDDTIQAASYFVGDAGSEKYFVVSIINDLTLHGVPKVSPGTPTMVYKLDRITGRLTVAINDSRSPAHGALLYSGDCVVAQRKF